MDFVHLHVHSSFSFLDGASSVEALLERAEKLDMLAFAITDHNNLCAAVKFHRLALDKGIKPIIGTELTLREGYHLTLLAKNFNGYKNLCRILTRAHLDNPYLCPAADTEVLLDHASDLFALSGCRRGEVPYLVLRGRYREALEAASKYVSIFGRENFYIELQGELLPGNQWLNRCLMELAKETGLECAAANNVHYARADDFKLHDVLTCIRTGTTLNSSYPERRLNDENYLKSSKEMKELFPLYPQALENTVEIASQCSPVFEAGKKFFPGYRDLPAGETSASFLQKTVYCGAEDRYGSITGSVMSRLEHELKVICELGYEDYFLMVWDIVKYARKEGIRFAGRGSAVDSAAAYCLFITDVDPIDRRLLFERFLSPERAQCPDIDIDIDARYRDKVAEYVYRKYGEGHAAGVCTYSTFRARSAWREIGKAMEFPEEEIDRLANVIPHIGADKIREAAGEFPELKKSDILLPRYEQLLDLCKKVADLPRFIGTHLGGVVVSDYPVAEIAPLQRGAKGTVIVQYDKDFVEELGLIKLDLLSLRTMSVIEDTVRGINAQGINLDCARLPLNDKATYEVINSAETFGVFQLESPAQRALQARLKVSNIEDIIASVALIRPGPVKGNMVEPFLERRHGREKITYLHPDLEPVLRKTYGVVLFQEQVIEIASVIAGFTRGEADQLRKIMTSRGSQKSMQAVRKKFTRGALENGLSLKTAEAIYSHISSYANYGFCEGHAAAFGMTAYITAYLITHYPAEYYAALLSHQPMGYYSANTLCGVARNRGIPILLPDINRSGKDFCVEDGALRVSLRQVKGMKKEALESIIEARTGGEFTSLADFCNRTNVSREILENLILCGAFDKLNNNRRQLIWQFPGLISEAEKYCREEYQLFPKEGLRNFYTGIPDFSVEEKKEYEYRVLKIDVREHRLAKWRECLRNKGILSSVEIKQKEMGAAVSAAGILIHPHRPPTRSGRTVAFFSLEDEFGIIDVVAFENVYNRYGHLIFGKHGMLLIVEGKLSSEKGGISLAAEQIKGLSHVKSWRQVPQLFGKS